MLIHLGLCMKIKKAYTINKMAKDILYGEFLDNIITVSQRNPTGSFDLSSLIDLTENLRDSASNGRNRYRYIRR